MKRSIRLALCLAFTSCLPLAAAAPAGAAGEPPSALEVRLHTPASSRELRKGLLELARAHESDDTDLAGEALYQAANSWMRDGQADSAIATYRRAIAVRGGLQERHELIEALFHRLANGDADEALQQARDGLAAALRGRVRVTDYFRASEGWAFFQQGHPQDAKAPLAAAEARLAGTEPWTRRYARADLALNRPRDAYELLLPLSLKARGTDDEVTSLLERAIHDQMMSFTPRREVDARLEINDDLEATAIERFNGARVRFGGADGFPLGGVLLDAPAPHAPAVIVIADPGDTMAVYDSLAIALRLRGAAVMILDRRGSGWSVGQRCPLPGAWRGRETALETACGGDVRAALRALARETPIDTSGYQVVAIGASAGVAIRAAEIDRRIRAIALVRPDLDEAAIAPAAAALARTQVPVYLLGGGETDDARPRLQALYDASNRAASRMADTQGAADGILDVRADHDARMRLTAWLAEKKPARAATPTPPTKRR